MWKSQPEKTEMAKRTCLSKKKTEEQKKKKDELLSLKQGKSFKGGLDKGKNLLVQKKKLQLQLSSIKHFKKTGSSRESPSQEDRQELRTVIPKSWKEVTLKAKIRAKQEEEARKEAKHKLQDNHKFFFPAKETGTEGAKRATNPRHEDYVRARVKVPEKVKNPVNQRLVDMLPDIQGRQLSSATGKSYAGYWRRFLSFLATEEETPDNASTVLIEAFLSSLAFATGGINASKTAYAALRYYYGLSKEGNKMDDDSINRTLAGLKRDFSRQTNPRQPLSPEDFRKLTEKLLEVSPPSPQNRRQLALLVVMFYTCARFEEVQYLDRKQISFLASGNIRIDFKKSKVNQYGNRNFGIIAKSEASLLQTNFCPVYTLEAYISWLQGIDSGGNLLFPSFRWIKDKQDKTRRTVALTSVLSYDQARN